MADEDDPIDSDKLRALVVDDEVEVACLVAKFLAREGKRVGISDVEVAGSAQEAIERLENGSYILVLSDMRMPGPSGADLLREVRERWPDAARMLMTGYLDVSQDDPVIRDAGIAWILRKPFGSKDLLASLNEVLT